MSIDMVSNRIKILLLSILLYIQFGAGLEIISREEWGAQPPTKVIKVPDNLPYVVIHHSASPAACYTTKDCQNKMRGMQRYHQKDLGWDDIGYNFAIGGDGNVYEGRGYNRRGAHAPGYNNNSIGIVFIGNWQNSVPSTIMITKTKELLEDSVTKGHVARNYKLLGHRQVIATECPGLALYREIQKWPNFAPNP